MHLVHATAVFVASQTILVFFASASTIRDRITRSDVDRAHCTDETFMKSGRCVSICGPGFFGERSTRVCRPCVSPCKTCDKTATTCTSCEDSLYLLNNECVTDCGAKLSKGPARSRLRLQGGSNEFEGRVEILHEGFWGTVCDDEWGLTNADVVCNELQLGTALEAVRVAEAGFEPAPLRTPIHMDDIKCHGSESKLEFCSRREWGEHNCGHFEDAGVRCSGPDVSRLCVVSCGDGYYRVPGTNQCELCAAECRTCLESADHCLSCEHPRFLRNGVCVENCGVEYHGNTGKRVCEPCHENCLNCLDGDRNDVCVSCQDDLYLRDGRCVASCDPQLAKNLAIRLADGPSAYEGRVEVFVDGEWGTVCDDQWDINDAEVVCQELGHGHALAAIKAPAFGPGIGRVLLDEVDCDGSEAEVINCRQRAWAQNDCNHHEDAGVRCQGIKAMETTWGPITPVLNDGATGKCVNSCGIGYFLKDQNNCIACAAQCLDCVNGPDHCSACKPPHFLQGNQCVDKCSIYEYGNTQTHRCESCDKSQCARCGDGETNNNCTQCEQGMYLKGSSCVSNCSPDMYRLNNTCKPECGAGLYGNPSSFVCEGCPSWCNGCAYDESSTLVCTSCIAPKIFNNGQCYDSCPTGSFSSLMDMNNLSSNYMLRLIGGNDQLEGRLEVFNANQWGTICNDYWGMDAAHIACKELNLGDAVAILSLTEDNNLQPGDGLIWLDNVICTGTEGSLSECYHQDWGQQDHCNHQKDVAIRCSGPGIRECLTICPTGQYADPTDRSCKSCHANCLQCTNGPYTCTQCAEGTHRKDTECVSDCGQGYYHGDSNVCQQCNERCSTCEGSANRCTSCTPDYYLQVMDCVTECNDYKLLIPDKVRVVPGPLEGRVEVKYKGNYGTVCDDQWSLQDAEVVCQMLGLGHAVAAIPEGRTGPGTGTIVLDEVKCLGNETSILSCPHAGLGINDCQHSEDAGVRCSGPMTSNLCISKEQCSTGYFVADDGISCGKCSFNCKTCAVSAEFCTTCQAGQYLSGENVCVETCEEGFYGDDIGLCTACSTECQGCTYSSVQCTSCPKGKFLDNTTNTCVDNCNGKYLMKGAGTIRLAGDNNPLKGRLEIFVNGEWGTVCDDKWDIKDAEVVCRQLGMGRAVNSFTNGAFGPGNGPIWMDDVECTGEERMLMQCGMHRLGLGSSDCTHQEDTGVECAGPDSSMMCVDECGEGFFPNNSVCVHCDPSCLACDSVPTLCKSCRAPNYLNGTTCVPKCDVGFYGNTNTQTCEACDGKCTECFDGPANNMCKSCMPGLYLEGGKCVSTCNTGQVLEHLLPPAPATIQVRLIGGSNTNEGRVEVYHDNQWGTVCMNGWDLDDAEIVCQELGLGHAEAIPRAWKYGQVDATVPIWMDNVNCIGWENSVVQCAHSGWEEGNCDPRHTQDAAVHCDGSSYRRADKNTCRVTQEGSCRPDSCYSRVTCIDLPLDRSVCMECPEGMLGDGKNCISISTEPPTFKNTPGNRTARVGFAASMSCLPDGAHAPPITPENWLKDGQPISITDLNSGRLRVLGYGNLHFVRTRREDTGEYSCVLKNTMGSASASAHLLVEEPPQILMVKPDFVAIGDTALVACMIGGLPLSTVSWHYNGERVAGNRYKSFNSNGTLLIENVTNSDEGLYQCIAENSLGIDHASVSLTVNEPPTFTAAPKDISVEEGTQVLLNCRASGKPDPSIMWKKDGDDLLHLNNKYVQHSSGDLTINNIERADMGIYTCIAVNSVQPSAKSVAVLVIGLPHVLEAPANESLSTGETFVIPCKVMAAPIANVTWLKDGIKLEENSRYKFLGDGLQINKTNSGDTGVYTCVATNAEGVVTNSARINVSGEIIYGSNPKVGLITGIFIMILILFVIAIAIYFFLRRRKEKNAFAHKQFGDIVKKSKGKSLSFDPHVLFSGGNYVKIHKQMDDKDKDKQGILQQSSDDLNDAQL